MLLSPTEENAMANVLLLLFFLGGGVCYLGFMREENIFLDIIISYFVRARAHIKYALKVFT